FLALMVGLVGARRCIEVGTFTGSSSLAVALALPAEGTILCCDISEEYTAVARRYWRRAGVTNKITLEIGPAAQTLRARISDGEAASYDLAFIDADKTNYDNYYELCLELLRPGGVVMIDNVLWHGAAADPRANTPDAKAIKALNAKIGVDDRVESVLLPLGDGHMVCRKLP
ncbi:MAG: O-methyltransferase, partial [Alphaproteobacteria bacterium]